MRIAKKIGFSTAATLLIASLSGCDAKEESVKRFIQQTAASSQPVQQKTFHRQMGDLDINITYRYKDDVVLAQTTQDTIPYRVLPAKNRIEAEAIMGRISDVYRKMAGISQTVEYLDNRANENLSIDFTQAEISQVCALKEITVGMIITDCSAVYLTMAGVEKFMREQDFNEVK